MSHELDLTKGQAALAYSAAGGIPWHSLGTSMSEGEDLETWIERSGLNFEVGFRQLFTSYGDSTMESEFPTGYYSLVRNDSPICLGVVSQKYRVVQPREVVEFFRDLITHFGFQMETAGSLKQGRVVWGLGILPDQNVKGESFKRRVMVSTEYGGTGATRVGFVLIRVVCNNTYRIATRGGNLTRIVHRRDINWDSVRKNLGFDTEWARHSEQIEKMMSRRVGLEISMQYFNECFRSLNPRKEESPALPIKMMTELLDIRENAPGQQGIVGTVWGDFNTATYYIDHRRNSRDQESDFYRKVFPSGELGRIKGECLKRALQLC